MENFAQLSSLLLQACGVIILSIIGFSVTAFMRQYKEDKANTNNRLNSHSTKFDEVTKELSLIKVEHEKTKGVLNSNQGEDKLRMELLNEYFKSTTNGINDIKDAYKTQALELKQMDQRVTQYIINDARKS